MTELFDDIPEAMKLLVQATVDTAFQINNPAAATKMIEDLVKRLPSERLKEVCDFYFDLKMMEYKNNNE